MKVLFFSIIFFICIINSYNCNEIPNGLYIIKNKANLNLCLMNSSLYFTSEESCQFYIHKKDIPILNDFMVCSLKYLSCLSCKSYAAITLFPE